MVQHDLLRRLPGITEKNYWNVVRSVRDLRELSNMGVDALTPILGVGNAKKLHAFFNRRTRGSAAARAVVIDLDADDDTADAGNNGHDDDDEGGRGANDDDADE